MKKVLVKDLKEGDIFSKPVYIEGNSLFVPSGIAIKKKDIDKLVSWGIESVETDGEPILAAQKTQAAPEAAIPAGIPVSGQSNQPNKVPGQVQQDNFLAYRTYMELIEQMDKVCTSIGEGTIVEANSIDSISNRLLKAVQDQRSYFIGYILGEDMEGHGMAKNLVNTAILSAMVAMELKLSINSNRILKIVTGALLHDVGMLRMPRDILEKRGGLSQAEHKLIQSHTLYAFQIVTKELHFPEDVGLIVLQHHERWDGEGYPKRIAGADIDLGARIVSVTGAFEAMVSQKPYRNPMIGYHAMKNLLSDNLRRYDSDVIKTFIQTMGIYPVGSTVLLNNGAMATVVDAQATAPLRPTIRIIADGSGETFTKSEGKIIDLLAEKGIFITKAVDSPEKKGKGKNA